MRRAWREWSVSARARLPGRVRPSPRRAAATAGRPALTIVEQRRARIVTIRCGHGSRASEPRSALLRLAVPSRCSRRWLRRRCRSRTGMPRSRASCHSCCGASAITWTSIGCAERRPAATKGRPSAISSNWPGDSGTSRVSSTPPVPSVTSGGGGLGCSFRSPRSPSPRLDAPQHAEGGVALGLPDEHGPGQLPIDVREVRETVMKGFLRQQLERFLEAVEHALDQALEVVVIGGSAAALHYGVARATHDIDTWTAVQAALAAAAERARAITGLDVPLQKSGVADAPCEFESRLERILPSLTRLKVLVPGEARSRSDRRDPCLLAARPGRARSALQEGDDPDRRPGPLKPKGRDDNGDSVFNDRPTYATDPSSPDAVSTPWGVFSLRSDPSQASIPRNLGEGPGFFVVNLRISRTFRMARTPVPVTPQGDAPPPDLGDGRRVGGPGDRGAWDAASHRPRCERSCPSDTIALHNFWTPDRPHGWGPAHRCPG